MKKSVVIAGAGFTGLTAALNLDKEFQITVISSRPNFEFTPNIHELVSGSKSIYDVQVRLKDILNRANIKIVHDSVKEVIGADNKIITSSGEEYPYECLLVATGGENNTFSVPGAEEFSLPFKTVSDCSIIYARLTEMATEGFNLPVVIVGGGVEGIEALGEIIKKFGHNEKLEIIVIEKANSILGAFPEGLAMDVQNKCAEYNVKFLLDSGVDKITDGRIFLDNGEDIETAMVIWTGGVKPPALLYESGLSESPNGWAPVRDTLQSYSYSNIFIGGDSAGMEKPIPKLASHATDMGIITAENIRLKSKGRLTRRFRPSSKPQLITLGDLETYFTLDGLVIAGKSLNFLKEAIMQVELGKFSLKDPSMIPQSAMRLINGIYHKVFPSFLDFRNLLSLPRVRVLSIIED